MNGHLAARGAHGDADVTGGECGRVVDAVADDRDAEALSLAGPDELHLVLRETFGDDLGDADLLRHAVGDRFAVTADHGDATDAGLPKSGDGLGGLGAGLVLKTDPADALGVAGDEEQAEAGRFVEIDRLDKITGDTVVAEPGGAADQDAGALKTGADAAAGGLAEFGDRGQWNTRFTGQLDEGARGGVVGELFRAGAEAKQLGGGGVTQRIQAADHELAGGEGAGLVEDEGGDAGSGFEIGDVFHQDAEAGGRAEGGDHRGGRGENESAGTGANEHADDAVEILGEGPDEGGDHQHQRRIVADVLVHDPHERELGLFRGENQFADPAEGGVLARAGDLHLEGAVEIHRAGEDLFARALVDRERFTGDGGLVDRALPAEDDAVGGDVVARTDADDIANRQGAGGDLLLAAGDEAAGAGGGDLDERFDRGAGAGGGAGLDDLAEQHEEGDDAGGAEIPLGRAGENAEGHQFIDAETAEPQVLEGDQKDRVGEDDRAGERTEVPDGAHPRGDPFHHEGVEDEDESDERLPQLHVGVAVVEAAVIVITAAVGVGRLGKQGGDLHGVRRSADRRVGGSINDRRDLCPSGVGRPVRG